MDKGSFTTLLLGKDLRTLGQNSIVVQTVHDQRNFDELFSLIFHHERALVMRAVDAIEKITSKHPEFLAPHKLKLLTVLKSADHKELKWHLAQLVTRVYLTDRELKDVWQMLAYWALNKNESKIVRVNALQGLFDLSKVDLGLKADFEKVISAMEYEMIPSIQARIRKLRNTKN
jgi:hypothetical protein